MTGGAAWSRFGPCARGGNLDLPVSPAIRLLVLSNLFMPSEHHFPDKRFPDKPFPEQPLP